MQLILGDCLEAMGEIPDGSVDLIATDLPYGMTDCKWDVVIPFEPLWSHYRRVLKPFGAVVLMATQPFTTDVINSNRRWFRYTLVWNKKQSGSFQNAKYHPLRIHEDIVVFSDGPVRYFPVMRKGRFRCRGGAMFKSRVTDGLRDGFENYGDEYYPVSIIEIPNGRKGKVHPSQKPVALFEYLIRTYSDEGDTVLDCCMGSGTTGVACLRTGRRFIGIEKDPKFFDIARRRIDAERLKTPLLGGIA
jgi:site-specific DNA-methyltransferase (adenine-specific)